MFKQFVAEHCVLHKEKTMQKNCRGDYQSPERGITLIALIITIIILIILAAVSINAAYNSGIVEYAVNGTENYINASEKEKNSIKNAQTVLESALSDVTLFVEDKGVNTPKITDGMIPIKWDKVKEKWVVCARNDAEWYDYASAEEIEEDSEREMAWANMMLSDGKYNSKTVQVGQEVADSDLGSMFVWIPRYAYSIKQYKTIYNGTDGTTQNITEVAFLKGTSNEDTKGKRYATDYDADKQRVGQKTEMIVHPAFNFGGKQLTGIWVAKFEASKGENNVVKVLPNVASWRNDIIGDIFYFCYKMKDNNNPYGLSTSVNSHLIKNSEWGVATYLAASQYGKIPAKNDTTTYLTGDGAYKDNTSQSTTGTVHGIYDMHAGSYDLVASFCDNGNANLAKGNPSNGNLEIFILNTETNKYEFNNNYAVYWDKYDVYEDDGLAGWSANTTNGNKQVAIATYKKMQLMKKNKGDAMYEVIRTFSFFGHINGNGNGTWLTPATYIEDQNGDIVVDEETFKDTTSSPYGVSYYDNDYICVGTNERCFIGRGSNYSEGITGIFSSFGSKGSSVSSGFRPVLTV